MSKNIREPMVIWQTFIILLLWYVVLTVVLYFFSPNMIFYPPRPASYQESELLLKLSTSSGNKISAVHLENPAAEYTLLYSHGNAEDLGYIFPLLQEYQNFGFSVIGYDYQGYGTSEGRYSEANTYDDIATVYQYLTQQKQIPEEKIILLGRSLGSGPSIDLAAKKKVGGIILESPLLTAALVLVPFKVFFLDRYNNQEKVKKITAPTLIIHGTEDNVIPFWHGKKLANLFAGPVQFHAINGAGHNNIISHLATKYWLLIQDFVNNLK